MQVVKILIEDMKESNDKQQLIPMIERMREQAGQRVQQVLADSGYCSEENLLKAAKKKIDLYVATGKQKHNQPAPASPRGRIRHSATLVDRMKREFKVDGKTALGIPKTEIKILLIEIPPQNWGIQGGQPASEVDVGFKIDV